MLQQWCMQYNLLLKENNMNDALEILDEIESIFSRWYNDKEILQDIKLYIEQKRTEFEPATGDCCG
jgi:hypothetical protein